MKQEYTFNSLKLANLMNCLETRLFIKEIPRYAFIIVSPYRS
jgi:hypothetical protein